MPWIVPAVVATLTNSLILAFVYLYLAWIERNRVLALFCLGWFIYTFRFIGMLGYATTSGEHTFWIALDETAAVGSSVVLLIAVIRFTGKHVPPWIWALVVLGLAWVGVISYLRPPLWISSLPVYFTIGVIFIYMGSRFWRASSLPLRESRFVGVVLIIWGLHKLDYPWLRPIEWVAPWGYLFGSILGLLAAMGIVLVYFRKTQDQFVHSQADYRHLVESAPYPIIVVRDDLVIYANRLVSKLLGVNSAEEILGENLNQHLTVQNIEEMPVDESVAPNYREKLLIATLPKQDNRSISFLTSGLDIEYEGEPARLVICQDVTEKLQTQERMRQAERLQALGTLAGGIAHDFNNILFAIQGYTEMVRQEMQPGTKPHHYLDEVLSACQRAVDLIKQILSFARQKEYKSQNMTIGSVVKEALRLLRASLPSTIAFDIQLEKQALDAVVNVDPTGIHQVVMNLCTNASHAMPDGGRLSVGLMKVDISESHAKSNSVMQPGKYVLLKVGDTGMGIPADVRQRIFEPFFTTKPQGKGTGLGLSVVHGLVLGFGGQITVESELDEGTEFSVYIPVANGHQSLQVSDDTLEYAMGSGKVLVVDDEPVLLDLLVQMTSKLGYEPVACADGGIALDKIKEDPDSYCAVVSDQTMPQMTGLELAKQLAQYAPKLPIILLTGYSAELTSDNWDGTAIKTILYKPLLQRDLAMALQSACCTKMPAQSSVR